MACPATVGGEERGEIRLRMSLRYSLRAAVDDEELSALHARAFGAPVALVRWLQRLEKHSLTWVTAWEGDRLVGFVNVIGDGGAHAVLLDTVVEPDLQGQGVGRALVEHAVDAARGAGCDWMHVDYEPGHAAFYEQVCGFRPTTAGLMRL